LNTSVFFASVLDEIPEPPFTVVAVEKSSQIPLAEVNSQPRPTNHTNNHAKYFFINIIKVIKILFFYRKIECFSYIII
jgi:hypothetical protein